MAFDIKVLFATCVVTKSTNHPIYPMYAHLHPIHFGRLSIAIWVAVNDGLYFAVIFLHFNHVKVVYLKMLGRIWGNIITRIILPIYDKPTAFSRIADFGMGVDSFFNGFG